MPTCPWVLPAVQLALLLGVEAIEVAPAAAVDEGPALGDSLVVVPPQCVALAVPLVQRQAAGLSCGEQTAMVRAGRSQQHSSSGGSRTRLAEEEKPQKGKAGDGSQLNAGRVWLEGTSQRPAQVLGVRAGDAVLGKPSPKGSSQPRLETELGGRWHRDRTATVSLGRAPVGPSACCCRQGFPAVRGALGSLPAAHDQERRKPARGSRSQQPSKPPVTAGDGSGEGDGA